MRGRLFFVLLAAVAVKAIKVPVDHTNVDKEEYSSEEPITSADQSQTVPTYYPPNTANVDSYLVPPDPHNPEEVVGDVMSTPATYLLPPAAEQLDYYFTPTVPAQQQTQSDWYPIAQMTPSDVPAHFLSQLPQRQSEVIPIFITDQLQPEINNHRGGKVLQDFEIPVPSRQLEPPLENAPNDYIVPEVNEELKVLTGNGEQFNAPIVDNERPALHFNGQVPVELLMKNRLNPADPTIALHLMPPRLIGGKYKSPTKLYPKKYSGGFKPVPIPVAEFADGSLVEVPRAKPVKSLKPVSTDEIEYLKPSDEKKIYLYKQAEQKRKIKGHNMQQQSFDQDEQQSQSAAAEQETSESFGHGHNAYPAPLRQAPRPPPIRKAKIPPSGDRTEFRMHGMKGPHSYQFGYDTGKGKNRQFRYEERDNDGHVRGHYGYVDKHGKMRVVNYDAHPEHGFRADPVNEETES